MNSNFLERIALIVAVLVFTSANFARAQDSVEAKLQTTQELYTKTVDELRASLVSSLERERAKAQRSGNLSLLKSIDSEIEAFKANGTLPKTVSPSRYTSQIERARARVITAFEESVRKYTQDGDLKLAETVQKQLEDFRKNGFENASLAIFNGRDLSGWIGNHDQWKVVDGVLVGSQSKKADVDSCIYSDKEYGDFELRCKLKLVGDQANSGIQIRSRVLDAKKHVLAGPQCDAGGLYWGSLYGENFGGMIMEAPQAIVARVLKPEDFNDFVIRCVGTRVTITLNGQLTVDGNVENMPARGLIGFQLHRPKGSEFQVFIRDLIFTPL